jgi:hypothetical protein
LYTVSAVQILAMVGAFNVLDSRGKGVGGGREGVGKCESYSRCLQGISRQS